MPECPAAGKRSCEARFCGGIEVPSRRVSAGRDLAKFGGPLQWVYLSDRSRGMPRCWPWHLSTRPSARVVAGRRAWQHIARSTRSRSTGRSRRDGGFSSHATITSCASPGVSGSEATSLNRAVRWPPDSANTSWPALRSATSSRWMAGGEGGLGEGHVAAPSAQTRKPSPSFRRQKISV